MLHNNRPPDNTEAIRHTSMEPNRSTHALAATAIASSASATPPPAGMTAPNSTSSTTAQRVKCALIASRSATNRRSQPRTVSTGTPNRPAIGRCPSPATLATIAAPITATPSRRRNSATSGSSTCVPPHPRQRARRGRKIRSPAAQRSTRARACPHGLNLPRHDGHPRTPPANSSSTRTRSAHTISMGATSGIQESPPDDHQADGRALAFYERANSATQPPIPAVNSANTPAHAELKRRSTCEAGRGTGRRREPRRRPCLWPCAAKLGGIVVGRGAAPCAAAWPLSALVRRPDRPSAPSAKPHGWRTRSRRCSCG